LWTAKVYIDGIAERFDDFGRGEELFGVVCAELDYERPIDGRIAFLAVGSVKVQFAIKFVRLYGEHLRAKISVIVPVERSVSNSLWR
jgi:hypothetical protein